MIHTHQQHDLEKLKTYKEIAYTKLLDTKIMTKNDDCEITVEPAGFPTVLYEIILKNPKSLINIHYLIHSLERTFDMNLYKYLQKNPNTLYITNKDNNLNICITMPEEEEIERGETASRDFLKNRHNFGEFW